jgi:hypothetical protein
MFGLQKLQNSLTIGYLYRRAFNFCVVIISSPSWLTNLGSQDSVIRISTCYISDSPRFNLSGGKRLPVLQNRLLALGLNQPPTQCVTGMFQGDNDSGREFDHSPRSSAEVDYKWSFTSTPPTCLNVVDGDRF